MIPKHIAIIMDGNGRWAKRRLLPRIAGHKVGLETAKKIAKACSEKGIEVLTLFAFSSENWQRPQEEVTELLNLFLLALQKEIKELHENNICLKVIGDISKFSTKLQHAIQQAETLTAKNQGLKLIIAANYGGRWDITQAMKKIAEMVVAEKINPEMISEDLINQHLATSNYPQPDLFIRTSGEYRISNFLLWQLAYTEIYITDTYWPDFSVKDLDAALKFFATRERRFGFTSEQITQN